MDLKQILKGHVKEMTHDNQELFEERIAICKKCPLFKLTKTGPICNPQLYLNVETNIAYSSEGPQRKRGCGCRLNAKARLEEAVCPANKW